jgi:hypothetical protein
METFSVQNLQALVIVAFDIVRASPHLLGRVLMLILSIDWQWPWSLCLVRRRVHGQNCGAAGPQRGGA